MKKFIRKVYFILLIIIIIILFNYTRLIISYLVHNYEYVNSFPIYGNHNNYVPQGLVYSEKYNIVLQTSYNSKHTVSMLYVIDYNSGKLLKELKLKEFDLSDNTSHVGGIASNEEKVWITSDFLVYEYDLNQIIHTKEKYIQSTNQSKLPIRGDFCTFHDNSLWIGDFFLNPFYKVKDNNPLLVKYSLESLDYFKPELIISLPKMVQGLVITNDNKFIFTESFTNLVHSNLSIYDNVLNEKSEIFNFYGKEIPYYKFSDKNLIKNIKLPPMAEGLFYKDKKLYILFESSSDTYFYAYPKLDQVIKFDIEKYVK